MDEQYLTRLGYGDFEIGLDRAISELRVAGYEFLPGGQGYRRPDGIHVLLFARLPLWMQVTKAHQVYAVQRQA